MKAGHGLGLVADIGGTNARFALVEIDGDHRRLITAEHLSCADYPTFEDSLIAYLRRVGAAPRLGVVAAAVAVRKNSVRFTNSGWHITPESLAHAGFGAFRLVNDYAAQAMALPLLDASRLFAIGPLASIGDGNLAVLGPGSGLGVAALIRKQGGDVAVATEGGHADFAPVDALEGEILRLLSERFGRVSNEILLSGSGLSRLHDVLQNIDGLDDQELPASEITERGLSGDHRCHETLLRFCSVLGSVAGNVALTLGATGGVFLAGGIVPRLLSILPDSAFRARFEAKQPMTDWVTAVPTLVITDTDSALFGAARLLNAPS